MSSEHFGLWSGYKSVSDSAIARCMAFPFGCCDAFCCARGQETVAIRIPAGARAQEAKGKNCRMEQQCAFWPASAGNEKPPRTQSAVTLHGDSVGQDDANQRSTEAIWPRKPTRQSIAQEKALSSFRMARLISGLLGLALLLLAEGIERLGQSVGRNPNSEIAPCGVFPCETAVA